MWNKVHREGVLETSICGNNSQRSVQWSYKINGLALHWKQSPTVLNEKEDHVSL